MAKHAKQVARRTKTLMNRRRSGVKGGKILGRYKVGGNFILKIGDGSFEWFRRQGSIEREAKWDEIYIIGQESQLRSKDIELRIAKYQN